ncbi:hypothetical protein ACFQ1I_26655 [Kitasatospora arboriphila]
MSGKRSNGEGSIYPRKQGGFAAYVWVTKPDGTRDRKYVYGKTRAEVHEKWLKLHSAAKAAPSPPARRRWAATSTTGSAKWSTRTSSPRRPRRTRCTSGSTSRRGLAPSGSTS